MQYLYCCCLGLDDYYGAGVGAEEAFAVQWLNKRRRVNVGHWMKMVEVYPCAGRS